MQVYWLQYCELKFDVVSCRMARQAFEIPAPHEKCNNGTQHEGNSNGEVPIEVIGGNMLAIVSGEQ